MSISARLTSTWHPGENYIMHVRTTKTKLWKAMTDFCLCRSRNYLNCIRIWNRLFDQLLNFSFPCRRENSSLLAWLHTNYKLLEMPSVQNLNKHCLACDMTSNRLLGRSFVDCREYEHWHTFRCLIKDNPQRFFVSIVHHAICSVQYLNYTLLFDLL